MLLWPGMRPWCSHLRNLPHVGARLTLVLQLKPECLHLARKCSKPEECLATLIFLGRGQNYVLCDLCKTSEQGIFTADSLALVCHDDDDDDGSLRKGRFIGIVHTTWGWDEWDGFPLPSSQTIMAEQLVQGRYAVAWGRFEPATLRLQGAEHTPTPLRPILYAMPVCHGISYLY